MAHKHTELMKILAQQILDGVENPGKLWEFKIQGGGKWNQFEDGQIPSFHKDCEYRLKPKSIMINGYKVPEPERVAPEIESTYFAPWPFIEKMYSKLTWNGNCLDLEALENGVVHLTPEAAAIHGKAIYSFTRNTTADAE